MINSWKKHGERKRLEGLVINNAIRLRNIEQDYKIIVSDSSIKNPFVVDAKLLKVLETYVLPHKSEKKKAYNIFNWIVNNIDYNAPWFLRNLRYGSTEKVLEEEEAVCVDMAFLYVTMARVSGLRAHVADVTRDFKNKKVCHACAIVKAEGKTYLADPAYQIFGIKHKKFRVIDDSEATQYYTGRAKE
ncbi:MAG: transglutaminase domain-containing protein [Nanoarchaeota archaeon]|nr:transglutaminase domain-containing protein [Nanoarchaeota archaeon]